MEIDVHPGTYVVAVSGGVDSMVLLDLLQQKPDLQLVAAHFDHGIRADSAEDRKLVQAAAGRYGIPFEYEEGHLGSHASEATARIARYDFLERIRQAYGAAAIVTAHHQDDLLETAVLNIMRGTGRKGLISLASNPLRLRPLLGQMKADIRAYADGHAILWREDSTNADDQYVRNYIRHHIMPRLGIDTRNALLGIIARTRITDAELDRELNVILQTYADGRTLDRRAFARLPHDAAKELLTGWLRANQITGFDARTIERVAVAAKTQRVGGMIDVIDGTVLNVRKDVLALGYRER